MLQTKNGELGRGWNRIHRVDYWFGGKALSVRHGRNARPEPDSVLT